MTLLGSWKKTMEHESDIYINWDWCSWYKGLIKGLEDLEITGRLETIQTTKLLRSVKNSQRVNNN